MPIVMPTMGIERTKTGPDSKTRALIIPECACFQVLGVVAVFFVVLLYYVHDAKVDYWNGKHELMDEKRKAEIFAHDASMTIMGLMVDFEAHLAHEIEWERMEKQMVERQSEIQEMSRIAINGIVYDSVERIGNLLENDLDVVDHLGKDVRNRVHDIIGKQQNVMNSKMSAAFDEYTSQTQDLNKVYLDKLQDEADKNRRSLQQAHEMIKKFAAQAGVGTDGLKQEELAKKIDRFFENVEKKAKSAKRLNLPAKVVKQIEQLLKDFDKLSPQEVVTRMTKMLSPGGSNQGKPKYGVSKYQGGSLQAYLEDLLFLQDFRTQLYPNLLDKKDRWESRELSSFALLQEILLMVEKGVFPATWLL